MKMIFSPPFEILNEVSKVVRAEKVRINGSAIPMQNVTDMIYDEEENKILIVGGGLLEGDSVGVKSMKYFFSFCPNNNEWKQLSDLPQERAFGLVLLDVVENKKKLLFFKGGDLFSVDENVDCFVYYFKMKKWGVDAVEIMKNGEENNLDDMFLHSRIIAMFNPKTKKKHYVISEWVCLEKDPFYNGDHSLSTSCYIGLFDPTSKNIVRKKKLSLFTKEETVICGFFHEHYYYSFFVRPDKFLDDEKRCLSLIYVRYDINNLFDDNMEGGWEVLDFPVGPKLPAIFHSEVTVVYREMFVMLFGVHEWDGFEITDEENAYDKIYLSKSVNRVYGYIFNIQKRIWKRVSIEAEFRVRRILFSACICGKFLYCYGGADPKENNVCYSLHDLFRFSLDEIIGNDLGDEDLLTRISFVKDEAGNLFPNLFMICLKQVELSVPTVFLI